MTPIFLRKNKLGSKNATTQLYGITIWKDAPFFAAVLAHERSHFVLKWQIFLASLIPAGLVGYILHPLAGIVIALAGFGSTLFPFVHKYSELRGHAIECAVAHRYYGVDLPAYQYKESWALADMFEDQEDAEYALIDMEEWAAHWVKRHAGVIERDMRRVKLVAAGE
jgi:hypothetical protein